MDYIKVILKMKINDIALCRVIAILQISDRHTNIYLLAYIYTLFSK
jgi:hypothetical protein